MKASDLFESPDTILVPTWNGTAGQKSEVKYYTEGNYSFIVSPDGGAGAISMEEDTGHADLFEAIRTAPFALVALPSYDELLRYVKYQGGGEDDGQWKDDTDYMGCNAGRVWSGYKVVSFWMSASKLQNQPIHLQMAAKLMGAIGEDIHKYAVDATGTSFGDYPSYEQFIAGKLTSKEHETGEEKEERERGAEKVDAFFKALRGKEKFAPREKPEPGTEKPLPVWGDSAKDMVARLIG